MKKVSIAIQFYNENLYHVISCSEKVMNNKYHK